MLIEKYDHAIKEVMDRVRETQWSQVEKAADLIVAAVKKGGGIHIYDTGHIIDSELVDRAGGLALLRRLRYTFEVISTARAIERKGITDNREGLAGYALRASKAALGDVLIIGSVSGKTVPVVDMALEAHKLGLTVIAVTSMAYSSSVSSDHSCGKRLYEIADMVIDNCSGPGDAMLSIDGIDGRFAPSSGISAAYIMWCLSACIIEKMLEAGLKPTVFQSVNQPDGWDRYYEMTERYDRLGI